ncbi:hypothetical protein SteCoe_20629 [Stentor coeruleus]|uniref:Uncharacterized protein n=1 Tax=Stentor coeruleus TaxID=5963 RepID=A0A1R2BRD0_9CILI|nr:hypothetical protein SteCoe_20629 [Stentor coeruleus]
MGGCADRQVRGIRNEEIDYDYYRILIERMRKESTENSKTTKNNDENFLTEGYEKPKTEESLTQDPKKRQKKKKSEHKGSKGKKHREKSKNFNSKCFETNNPNASETPYGEPKTSDDQLISIFLTEKDILKPLNQESSLDTPIQSEEIVIDSLSIDLPENHDNKAPCAYKNSNYTKSSHLSVENSSNISVSPIHSPKSLNYLNVDSQNCTSIFPNASPKSLNFLNVDSQISTSIFPNASPKNITYNFSIDFQKGASITLVSTPKNTGNYFKVKFPQSPTESSTKKNRKIQTKTEHRESPIISDKKPKFSVVEFSNSLVEEQKIPKVPKDKSKNERRQLEIAPGYSAIVCPPKPKRIRKKDKEVNTEEVKFRVHKDKELNVITKYDKIKEESKDEVLEIDERVVAIGRESTLSSIGNSSPDYIFERNSYRKMAELQSSPTYNESNGLPRSFTIINFENERRASYKTESSFIDTRSPDLIDKNKKVRLFRSITKQSEN